MPKFYNATQAALAIGISYRTIRRKIEAGQIEAIREEDGQYSIAQSEVERLKLAQSERPRPAMNGQLQPGHGQPDLERRVAELEQRVRTLEDMASQEQPYQPQAPESPEKLYRFATDKMDAKPEQSVQNRNVEPNRSIQTVPAHLPPGSIKASELGNRLGLGKEEFKRYLARGVNGEHLERIEIPHHTRPNYNERYFTPEQAEKAIEVLRRHGKMKEAND